MVFDQEYLEIIKDMQISKKEFNELIDQKLSRYKDEIKKHVDELMIGVIRGKIPYEDIYTDVLTEEIAIGIITPNTRFAYLNEQGLNGSLVVELKSTYYIKLIGRLYPEKHNEIDKEFILDPRNRFCSRNHNSLPILYYHDQPFKLMTDLIRPTLFGKEISKELPSKRKRLELFIGNDNTERFLETYLEKDHYERLLEQIKVRSG